MSGKNKIKAFTLAEVLITLMVIGVLAVITIPSILQSWEEQATVAKLKKTYSVLQQAFKLAINDNGTIDTWNLNNGNLTPIIPYLQIKQNCKNQTKGCFAPGVPKQLNNINYWEDLEGNAWVYKFQLIDGTGVAARHWNETCTSSMGCTWVYVDLNGVKGPNQFGKDLFFFGLNKYGLFAHGGPVNGAYEFYHNYDCKNISSRGFACSRWIIERGNMDYLHKTTTW